MILDNKICTVNISIDDTYTIGSADNKYYDVVMNPSNLRKNDLSKTFSILIDLGYRRYRIALIGSYLSCDSDCAVLEDRSLLVLQDDFLIKIDVLNETLAEVKRIDSFGNNFGIFRIQKGYVIYGEIEITMLNDMLEKQWTFSGKDIFVTQSTKKPFVILDDAIELFDWENNYYKIDFKGNLMEEYPAK